MDTTAVNKKRWVFLWILCILGFWSVLPYIQHLGILPASVAIWKVALLGTFQVVLLFGLICWISFKILPKTDLHPFPSLQGTQLFKHTVYPALISGGLVGVVIFVCETTLFQHSLLSRVHPPFWTGALASIYGAVNEEVLLRLFLFTLVYFLMGKCITIQGSNRLAVLWGVNIFVALLFGIGHLPAAFQLTSPSILEILRILFLNGIAGIVFGWLYWSRGFWTAVSAHFVTDIMIHALLI